MVYIRGDMFAGLSSVFTLAAISLERLHAIARPLRHRQLTLRSYAIAIATPWILSVIVTLVPVFLFITYIQASSVIIISLPTPLLITYISYCIIWRKQASRIIPNEAQARNNVHLNRTLLLITTIFVLSWLPFQVLAAVLNFYISCNSNKTLIILYVIKLLQFYPLVPTEAGPVLNIYIIYSIIKQFLLFLISSNFYYRRMHMQ